MGGGVGAWWGGCRDCVTCHEGGAGADPTGGTPSALPLQPWSDGGSVYSVLMGGSRHLGCNNGMQYGLGRDHSAEVEKALRS